MSDNDPETPSQRRNRVDPLTSSPGRDLPPFEEEELIAGEPQNEEEEDDDGEELFGDNMENDYRAMPALDRYDPNILDEGDYDMMSEADRAAAEAAMRKRDRDLGVPADGRMRRGLLYDEDDDEDEPSRRRRRLDADRAAEGRIDDEEEGKVEIQTVYLKKKKTLSMLLTYFSFQIKVWWNPLKILKILEVGLHENM